MPRKVTREEFIKRAREIHGDEYDYTQVVYKKQHTPVTITCTKHGPFQMTPVNHLYGKNRCPLCGSGKRRTTEHFVALAREVHGNRYDYSLAQYVNATTKVKIVCSEHGVFEQTPDMHCYSNQQGCPSCKASKGERKVYKTLVDLGIVNFVCEKTFDDLIAPDSRLPLKYDFYLPDQHVLIEYDGQQHFKKVNFNNQLTEKEMETRLARAKLLDELKNAYAAERGYNLIRIPFWEYKNIRQLLTEALRS